MTACTAAGCATVHLLTDLFSLPCSCGRAGVAGCGPQPPARQGLIQRPPHRAQRTQSACRRLPKRQGLAQMPPHRAQRPCDRAYLRLTQKEATARQQGADGNSRVLAPPARPQ